MTTTRATEREVEEPKGTISFSVRLTEKQRDFLTRAAEERGWTLTSLLKTAALEKAAHILNTTTPNKVDFRGTAERIARQVFTLPSGSTVDGSGELIPAEMYPDLEDAREDQAHNPVIMESPWPASREFLVDIRDAARYGGTEFLAMIIQAAEVVTSRTRPNLPDPIDPNSI